MPIPTFDADRLVLVECAYTGDVGRYPPALRAELQRHADPHGDDSRSSSGATSPPESPPSHTSAVSSPVNMRREQQTQEMLVSATFWDKSGKLCAAIHKLIIQVEVAPRSRGTTLCRGRLLEMFEMAHRMQAYDHEIMQAILTLVDLVPVDIGLDDALQASEGNAESEEARPQAHGKRPRPAEVIRWSASLGTLAQCARSCRRVMQYWQAIRFPGTNYEDILAAATVFMIEFACSILVPEVLEMEIRHKLVVMHKRTDELAKGEEMASHLVPGIMHTCPKAKDKANHFLAPTAHCTKCERGDRKCREGRLRWQLLCVALYFPTADMPHHEEKHKKYADASVLEANCMVMETRYGMNRLAIRERAPCVQQNGSIQAGHGRQQKRRCGRYGTNKRALLDDVQAVLAGNPEISKIIEANIYCTVRDMEEGQMLGRYMLACVFSKMVSAVWSENHGHENIST